MNGGTIVCGVDDLAEARPAAELASALGARLGLRLVLVHVLDGIPAGTDESVGARQQQSGAERMLALLAGDLGDGVETRLVPGARGETLAAVAAEEGADLIVVGSRATGLRGRTLRSGLARELEAATSVPVLVVPPATRRRSESRLELATSAAARSNIRRKERCASPGYPCSGGCSRSTRHSSSSRPCSWC
jgi:nucleotide-binding universal stress UspA family protein